MRFRRLARLGWLHGEPFRSHAALITAWEQRDARRTSPESSPACSDERTSPLHDRCRACLTRAAANGIALLGAFP